MSHIRAQHTRHHHSRAFTLIELLVVISIIGLLSSVVMAALNGARQKGTVAAGQKFDGHTHAAFYDDLVLSWDFDRDTATPVQDQSGNGNNLSLAGGATLTNTQNPFKSGQVLSVDATHTAQKAAPLNKIPSTEFSVSFWVYPTITNQTHYFISYYAAVDGSWRVGTTDTQTGLVFNFLSGTVKTASAGVLKINEWYHVAAVCKGGKIGLYLNGKSTGSTDTVSSCALASNNALNLNGTYPYYIDNVRIYSKALPLSFFEGQYLAEISELKTVAYSKKE